MQVDITLDLKGLRCPQPAIRTKRQLKTMSCGDVLHVICTDPMSAIDIPFLAQQLGHQVQRQEQVENELRFWLVVAGATDDGNGWPEI